MEIKFINCEYKEKIVSLTFEPSKIYGITGKNIEELIPIISLREICKGQIIVDENKITKDNIKEHQRKVSFVTAIKSAQINIYNIMVEYIKRNNLIIKDPIKKIKDSLKIVGLEDNILNKNIYETSTSEKKLLSFAIYLLSNPEVLIIEEPFKCLDKQNEKKIIMLLQRLKEQFKKTIIIISEDSNILYKYTNEMIFVKNNEILITGKTEELYLKVEYLKKNRFDIPEIVEFTHLAKKKKEVKIDYHKDVRDIIKDIYKHI
ncbi:MAG: ATP-binding cassette domain-containing protein [Bacilli bacterium]|nr:ATP-binding cassette domain-containing protein [Bacilli bacterium]